MTKKLDGSRIAAEIREEVGAEVVALGERGVIPRLDAVLVGEDPASMVYVGSKAKTLTSLGMVSKTHHLPETTSQAELEALVDDLNADPGLTAFSSSCRCRTAIDTASILRRVDPAKDVDGFHPENVGLLQQGRPRFGALHTRRASWRCCDEKRSKSLAGGRSWWGARISSANRWPCSSSTPMPR